MHLDPRSTNVFTVPTVKSGFNLKRHSRQSDREADTCDSIHLEKIRFDARTFFGLARYQAIRSESRNFKHLTSPRVSNHKGAFPNGCVNSRGEHDRVNDNDSFVVDGSLVERF